MQTITITIDKKGTPRVEASGFGAGCHAATAGVQGALGITTSDTPTNELFAPEVQQRVGQGR